MAVAVVNVRSVRMAVIHCLMDVFVGMRSG